MAFIQSFAIEKPYMLGKLTINIQTIDGLLKMILTIIFVLIIIQLTDDAQGHQNLQTLYYY